ncbi:hypothetical protein [Paenibacillus sp. FSL M7-0896]|uniref:hypothetical protein n=1 Tax=Paenibacillus sp. FSL M7-0896 TaxID=2921610 RepID=UPI0030DB0A27
MTEAQSGAESQTPDLEAMMKYAGGLEAELIAICGELHRIIIKAAIVQKKVVPSAIMALGTTFYCSGRTVMRPCSGNCPNGLSFHNGVGTD